jgi:hypothetical protein
LTDRVAERKIRGRMASLQQLLRSSLVVAGLLLLAVGIGDTVTGRSKVLQYQRLLRTTAAPAPADPTALFPTSSETQERHELARTKLGYYQMLLSVGQFLTVLGVACLATGIVRVRLRAPRSSRNVATPRVN